MVNVNNVIGNILGKQPKKDLFSKNMTKLDNVQQTISTMDGDAKYVGTETEDAYGRWNDSYKIRDGYYVIHQGTQHHVYKV
jgi:hypothetical protein